MDHSNIFEGEEAKIMELKKIPKLTRAFAIGFDKFHHLCNLYIFGYASLCNNLASSRLKCEVSFNFTSKTFTKKYNVQEQLNKIYNLVLPYFLTISPTICQIKSLSLHFFSFQKVPFLSFT